jgi:hypothetical protein
MKKVIGQARDCWGWPIRIQHPQCLLMKAVTGPEFITDRCVQSAISVARINNIPETIRYVDRVPSQAQICWMRSTSAHQLLIARKRLSVANLFKARRVAGWLRAAPRDFKIGDRAPGTYRSLERQRSEKGRQPFRQQIEGINRSESRLQS